MCARPWRSGPAEFGCGKCKPCRVNRARLWTGRMMLEALEHDENSFATLTYDDEHLPRDVSVAALQGFVRRLRDNGTPVRYFGVGEYGETTFRPHYHLALFGTSDAVAVDKAWGQGFTHLGNLTAESARYIAGYVVKGWTFAGAKKLQGRAPEFARMSLRPGIGGTAVEEIARSLVTKTGSSFVAREGDVVSSFRFGGHRWPLGRYLRQRLREYVGVDDEVAVVKYRQWLDELHFEPEEAKVARGIARIGSAESARARDDVLRSRKGIGL